MLTLYFSATGNTEYIAKLFSSNMNATCLSIETDVDFVSEINLHDTIAFCYPIYGSRVPRIMREFVEKHMGNLLGKKLIILVTQMMFSGDGARVFTDMFVQDTIQVIYAEHFNMPNNICNTPMLKHASKRKMEKCKYQAAKKMARICQDIKQGIIRKRGFSKFSMWIGNVQGKTWQGDSKQPHLNTNSMEQKAKSAVKIHDDCNSCGLCVKICPMKNLLMQEQNNTIHQLNNCTLCYRCVNCCPHKAITVLFHRRPKWQYKWLI